MIFTGSRPGFERGVDAVKDLWQRVATSQLDEAITAESVERDVHATKTRRHEVVGNEPKSCTVGGQSQIDTERGQLGDEQRQASTHGRLTSGEPDGVDAVALDEQPRDPLDLLEREHLVTTEPRHALLGHAVGAAEVAAVGDRDPQVTVDAPEPVDERLLR